MTFEDVLNDIELLIGMDINAINPQTGVIKLVSINREAKNFYVALGNSKPRSRPLSHLQKIWGSLSHSRVIDAEAVQGGSGSSRHVPETIFANLPYVEYFKYKRRKHLFLGAEDTHELGTIKESKSSDVRKIKLKLDNLNKFDHVIFAGDFRNALSILEEAIKEVKIKFPGDFKASKISDAESQLEGLLNKLDGTYLTPLEDETSNYINTIPSDGGTVNLDLPEIIGYAGGTQEEIDGEEKGSYSESEDAKELSISRIRFTPTTVSLIYDRLLHNEIELQPDFQRKGRIWSAHNKSALIESILIGLPIPTLYFAERANGTWVIVDGLQRTTTLYDFISNQFLLKDLKFLPKLDNCSFESLPRPYQRKIREYQLHCHIITIEKDSDRMVRELFQRINTYGVKMSYQEIRCALYPGNSVKFIRYMAESDIFQKATFGKVQPKRMKDMELVLGAVAFIFFGFESFIENKFDTFLTKCMQELNKSRKLNIVWPNLGSIEFDLHVPQNFPEWKDEGTAPIFIEIKNRTDSALILSEKIFGSDRFKKEIKGKVINKPLFELIISSLALLSKEDQVLLIERKDMLKEGLYSLLSDQKKPYVDWESEHFQNLDRNFEYSVSQSTGKRVTILYRFKNFQALLEEVLDKKVSLKGILKKYDKQDKP